MEEQGKKQEQGSKQVAVGAYDKGVCAVSGQPADNGCQGIAEAGGNAAQNAGQGKVQGIGAAAGYCQDAADDVEQYGKELCSGHCLGKQEDREQEGKDRGDVKQYCTDRHSGQCNGKTVTNIIDPVTDQTQQGTGKQRFSADQESTQAETADGEQGQDQNGKKHPQKADLSRCGAAGFHFFDKDPDGTPQGSCQKNEKQTKRFRIVGISHDRRLLLGMAVAIQCTALFYLFGRAGASAF